MAFFPDSILPNRLMQETQQEVDGHPSIFNAKDYNIHHRELVAIEKRILASKQVVAQVKEAMNYICSGLMFSSHAGTVTVKNGTTASIVIPSSFLKTRATDPILATDTSIAADTSGFPSSGYITKFNNNAAEAGETGSLLQAPTYKATNQEIIQYTSITATSFEGCTRGMFGTTAQDWAGTSPLGGTEGALLLGGRATISFYPASIATQGNSIEGFSLYQDALLQVRFDMGPTTVPATEQAHVRYVLMVIGSFPDIDLGALLED